VTHEDPTGKGSPLLDAGSARCSSGARRAEELREQAARVPGALLETTGLGGAEVTRLREELWRLVAAAHDVCPYSNATHAATSM
jgi:hypothetical protein